jgi:hypothetical protein
MTETFRLEDRLAVLRGSKLNGIDEVEVRDDGYTLVVRFFHDAPSVLAPKHLRLKGGVAVRDIRIIDVSLIGSDDPDLPTLAAVSLDRPGDASSYELELFNLEHIDPRYRSAPFTFYPDFEGDLDCGCAPSLSAAASTLATPPIDYLAKDYGGFRQLILDRLAVTMPDWSESHVPDIGIMLVELLAYVADRLSYYQDAVATEACLGTARRRISVRRHARLVDYRVHEGANARALVQINPPADAELVLADVVLGSGRGSGLVQFRPIKAGRAKADLRAANAALSFHCWGNRDCVLVAGSTSATLVDPDPKGPESLRSGDFLLFEVIDQRLGGVPDADPSLRHPVRLTRVRRSHDPLLDVPLIEITWSREDATPVDFPLDVADETIGQVTVARANLVLVDQGREIAEGDHKSGTLRTATSGPGSQRTLALSTSGLGFAAPIGRRDSARKILTEQDPRAAVPMIERLTGWQLGDDGAPAAGDGTTWDVRPDLIESGPDDPHAVVEIDDDGAATLRFGDGVCGRDPTGIGFEIVYRVGVGTAGNLGAESIGSVSSTVQPDAASWAVRNPLAAGGAVAPEDLAQVRLLAPQAFRNDLVRAVDAQDYATLAEQLEPEVQHATCSLVRYGARSIARVAIDPRGTDMPVDELVTRVETVLEPFRHIGHDIVVTQGKYVPLLLVLNVTVAKGFVRGHVRQALMAVLGSGRTPSGGLAPFNPDKLGFGTPIYGSPLIAAAVGVTGVHSAAIGELARLFDRERGGYENGVLAMAWDEIPRLDNDPLRPDNGRLELRLEGGLP